MIHTEHVQRAIPLLRVRVIACVLGATLGVLCAPLLAVAGFLGGGWTGAPGPGVPVLLSTVHSALYPLFHFESPDVINRLYGRPLLLVFPALIAWVTAVRAARSHAGPFEARLLRAAQAGLALNVLGNVSDYWLGPDFNLIVWRAGFALGTALGLLVALVATTWIGGLYLKRGVLRPASVVAVLALPAAALLTVWGVKYIPAAQVIPLCLAWAALSVTALFTRRAGG